MSTWVFISYLFILDPLLALPWILALRRLPLARRPIPLDSSPRISFSSSLLLLLMLGCCFCCPCLLPEVAPLEPVFCLFFSLTFCSIALRRLKITSIHDCPRKETLWLLMTIYLFSFKASTSSFSSSSLGSV